MKTVVLFVASMFFIHGICRAQDATPYERSCQSQLFGEASGPGVGLSLNYEKLFWKANNGVGFSAGAGLCPFIDAAAITIPFGLNYVHGRKYAFELGAGSTPLVFTGAYSSDSEWMFYLLGGYRQLLLKGDVIGRIFFSPFLAKKGSILASNLDVKGGFIPYGGISLGLILKKKVKDE
ncbi:MAG: hypothetical protein ACXVBJ_11185 [Flavisolibacter sp.]